MTPKVDSKGSDASEVLRAFSSLFFVAARGSPGRKLHRVTWYYLPFDDLNVGLTELQALRELGIDRV